MALSTLPEPTSPRKNSSKHKQIIQKKQNQNQKRSSYDHVLVTTTDPKKPQLSKHKDKQKQKQKQPSSWDQIKNLLTCKQIEDSRVHDPSKNIQNGYSKLGSSCSSICSFKDVVHGNTRVVHRADNSPEGSTVSQDTGSLSRKTLNNGSSSTRSTQGSQAGRSQGSNAYGSRGMQFRKLSGCYECRMIVDPSRQPMPRTTIYSCPQCGEVFPKLESLELHQKIRHAVSELGPEDSGRHIVEIIFKSGWFKNDDTICKIERILKVHNTQRTIQRFEDCRDAIKLRALNSTRKDPRCAADGNELLRFYCTSLTCNLGARGASSLCSSVHSCGVCATIRHGFHNKEGKGVRTTATSGKANESCCVNTGRRAMLVCRVIAGRVKRREGETPFIEEVGGSNGVNGSYDSLGISSNLEELFVFNPRAILPCFVVIYKTL